MASGRTRADWSGRSRPLLEVNSTHNWAVKPNLGVVRGVEPTTAARELRKLTDRGRATRTRILERAAELIHAQGVHATNNEQVRRAAGVSGSQLSHYFPTKESLVLTVIAWRAERVLAFHREEQFARFDTFDAFRTWAAFWVSYERAYQEDLAHAATRPHEHRSRSHAAGQPASCGLPGGMLLAQVSRDIVPLEDALHAAIDYVQSFVTVGDAVQPQAR
jgi:TetR/AcrR family transcriptional regulator, transcriptional repressor for nem operon